MAAISHNHAFLLRCSQYWTFKKALNRLILISVTCKIMHFRISILLLTMVTSQIPCQSAEPAPTPSPAVEIVQTSRDGDRLTKVAALSEWPPALDRTLTIDPETTYQTLVGIGGSFTESSAYVLSELSAEKQKELMKAYFSPGGAHYSLTRTHIASCDFSLRNYTYAPVPSDNDLEHFSVEPDETYLLPMIRQAQAVVGSDFRIIASPWTPPPWMKDNQTWNGGALKAEHYATFAKYFVKYIQAYAAMGIPVWGITPENEPLGNDSNWESCHFTPEEMRNFIVDHLAPALRDAGLETGIWVYDQNRDEEMLKWAKTILGDPESAALVEGMAVHWYQSTIDVGGEIIDEVQQAYPNHRILHSEGCVDALGDDEPIGSWLEDDWYWRPEATDWGKFWAPPEKKKDHTPYRAFYRYTRDLIGGLNHNLVGWVDWNMILNTRGGPNHARNFCLAPVLVDSGRDAIYYTPLYYAVAHLSRYLRPGAVRLGLSGHDDALMATAFRNPDGSIAVVVFNTQPNDLSFAVNCYSVAIPVRIKGQAIQTILIHDH
jgi:glucosylceramidase